jgi:uncharacterized membrane protein YhaH (DUF805 family)
MNQPVPTPANDMRNPYAAPTVGNMTNREDDTPQKVKIFAVSGRIGRVRYIGYSIGLTVILMLVVALLGEKESTAPMIAIGIAYLANVVLFFMLTIQRCHDFDTTGWLSLAALIPLVSLIFWFIPGTDGPNRWGNKTEPNTTGSTILVLIFPIIFVVGILAAIAIPQYQQYVQRAKTMQTK